MRDLFLRADIVKLEKFAFLPPAWALEEKMYV